jgi:hypothetical protein
VVWALFSSHQATNRCELNLRVVLLGAPTSLASIMVIGTHHAAATHVGEAPKRASGSTEHVVWQGGHRSWKLV